MELFVLTYNNYYNRIIKKETTLNDYLNTLETDDTGGYIGLFEQSRVNFNPGDGVTTAVIVGRHDNPFDGKGDYVIITEDEVSNKISSRWFVLQSDKVRCGQYRLTLRRDVIADYTAVALTADTFIERGFPASRTDYTLFNKEGMDFNQKKIGHQKLFDKSGCAWIVGYIPRNAFPEPTTKTIQAYYTSDEAPVNTKYMIDNKYFPNCVMASGGVMLRDNDPLIRVECSLRITGTIIMSPVYFKGRYFVGNSKGVFEIGGSWQRVENLEDLYGTYSLEVSHVPRWFIEFIKGNCGDAIDLDRIANEFFGLYTPLAAEIPPLPESIKTISGYAVYTISSEQLTELNNLDGVAFTEQEMLGGNQRQWSVDKSYRDKNDYKIVYQSKIWDHISKGVNKHEYRTGWFDDYFDCTGTLSPGCLSYYDNNSVIYKLNATCLGKEYTITIPSSTERAHLVDEPYDMFCIPFPVSGGSHFGFRTDDKARDASISANPFPSLSIAQRFVDTFGSDNVYDLQILPYCPLPPDKIKISESGTRYIDIDPNGNSIATLVKATKGDKIESAIIWCTQSSSEGYIDLVIPLGDAEEDIKIKTETEFVRFCSPNMSNFFDFDPQMNFGLEQIHFIQKCKPFAPYIKVQPMFKGLYGKSDNDARGLICGGDYSLARLTNEWANYELQNKNYLAIFDRQAQHLKTTREKQREGEVIQAAIGTITGVVGGAVSGGMMSGGNPYAAAAGALVGGIASGIAGAKDIEINDALHREQLSYNRDVFDLQMGNIKALPYGLAKTTAISPDHRFVPYIEYYTATDEEKEVLRQSLRFRGYKLNKVAQIQTMVQKGSLRYFKGQILRFNDFNDDANVALAIAEEIKKGVYL